MGQEQEEGGRERRGKEGWKVGSKEKGWGTNERREEGGREGRRFVGKRGGAGLREGWREGQREEGVRFNSLINAVELGEGQLTILELWNPTCPTSIPCVFFKLGNGVYTMFTLLVLQPVV